MPPLLRFALRVTRRGAAPAAVELLYRQSPPFAAHFPPSRLVSGGIRRGRQPVRPLAGLATVHTLVTYHDQLSDNLVLLPGLRKCPRPFQQIRRWARAA